MATRTGRRQTLAALLLAALLLSTLPGVASGFEIPEKPRPDEAPRGAVLTGEAANGFMQGTFWGPGPLTLWNPGPAEIARLEEPFPAFVARQKPRPDLQPLHEYYRQYVGVIRNGKRLVCVNLFHYSFVRESLAEPSDMFVKAALDEGGRAEDFWKIVPIFVSDGGAYSFQAQFDAEVGAFLSVSMSGHA